MRKSLRHLSLLTGISLFAAACGDLSDPSHQLTDDEAAFLAQEFAGIALQGVSGSMSGSPGLAGSPANASAAGPITWQRSFTETRPCPAGGTVTTGGTNKGTIDSETHSGTVEVSHTLSMDDCARVRNEITFTVTTDPDIIMVGTVTIEAGHRTGGSFTKTGTFLWTTSDGRSGSCEVNLTIAWNADDSHTITGTVCGKEVNREGGDRHREG